MDTAFFIASKIIWFFIEPGNVLLILIFASAILVWTRWKRLSKIVVSLTALLCLFFVTVPVGGYGLRYLENRFPTNPALSEHIDGIIVLGGSLSVPLTKTRKQTSLGGSVERIINFVDLANRYPNAKLIYTGGSGEVMDQSLKEANFVTPILKKLGLNNQNLLLESESRNTFENAVFSYNLASPQPNETWVLITSATHMPRAVGAFRAANWPNIIPYPVDYNQKPDGTKGPPLRLMSGMGELSHALHEWLGLLAYYITGKSNNFIPAP